MSFLMCSGKLFGIYIYIVVDEAHVADVANAANVADIADVVDEVDVADSHW